MSLQCGKCGASRYWHSCGDAACPMQTPKSKLFLYGPKGVPSADVLAEGRAEVMLDGSASRLPEAAA